MQPILLIRPYLGWSNLLVGRTPLSRGSHSLWKERRGQLENWGIKGEYYNSRQKTHFKAKHLQSAGSSTSIGPSNMLEGENMTSSTGLALMDSNFIQINEGGAVTGLVSTMGHPNSFIALGQPNEDSIKANNELIPPVGYQKTSNKKPKAQRMHNVVHGSLENVSNQKGGTCDQSNVVSSQEHNNNLVVFGNARPSDHWDPNAFERLEILEIQRHKYNWRSIEVQEDRCSFGRGCCGHGSVPTSYVQGVSRGGVWTE